MVPSPEDPIAALATPPGTSALAVVRVSGLGCLELLGPLLRGRAATADMPANTVRLFTAWDGEEQVDEVMVAVYRAPRSYTGEDCAEITCHGGTAVARRLLSLLGRAGFRPAGPGEFTQRAFLNGRVDLTRAEAVDEIVRARTDRARALALARLGGAVESRVGAARALLVDLKASLEVMIDSPDDEPGDAVDEGDLARAAGLLRDLAGTFRQGRVYQEGAVVALAGATNAGKSRLFNALLREDRAIVSEEHGTTRDWIEATVSLEGIPVRLVDTAGLRDAARAAGAVEREGIRRTAEVIRGADAVIEVVDACAGPAAGGDDLRSSVGAVPVVRAWNKVDLPGAGAVPPGFLPVSAATGEGLPALVAAVAAALLGGPSPGAAEPLIDSERQRDLLERAVAALERFSSARAAGTSPDLLAVDLADALDALGEITGEVTSAEVLDRMFGRFCVGK